MLVMEPLKCCSAWRFSSLCAVSITLPLWECFHAKMTGTVCPWQQLAPLKKTAIYLLISTAALSQSTDGTSLIPARVEGQQRGLYICTFAFITEISLAVSYRMIQKRASIWISNRALCNLPEWLEFLSQDSFSQDDLHGRIFKKLF